MALEARMLLAAMQHADSFFPSGSGSFSWGLEGLANDARLSRRDMAGYVMGQLAGRWLPFDRVFTAHAHGAAENFSALAGLDRLQDSLALGAEQRRGSRAAGRSLLLAHSKLGTPLAREYRDKVVKEHGLGHLATAQGLVARAVGLDLPTALAVSGYTFCLGLLGAAARLGIAPNLEAQRLLAGPLDLIAEAVHLPVPDLSQAWSYVPETDIAMMRHERQDGRLFAN